MKEKKQYLPHPVRSRALTLQSQTLPLEELLLALVIRKAEVQTGKVHRLIMVTMKGCHSCIQVVLGLPVFHKYISPIFPQRAFVKMVSGVISLTNTIFN